MLKKLIPAMLVAVLVASTTSTQADPIGLGPIEDGSCDTTTTQTVVVNHFLYYVITTNCNGSQTIIYYVIEDQFDLINTSPLAYCQEMPEDCQVI